MPAEVEYVPRRQRPFYLIYAVLSGIYGYVLLTFLTVLTYNVLHTYSPAWAFVPATLMGYWVFRARIHTTWGDLPSCFTSIRRELDLGVD